MNTFKKLIYFAATAVMACSSLRAQERFALEDIAKKSLDSGELEKCLDQALKNFRIKKPRLPSSQPEESGNAQIGQTYCSILTNTWFTNRTGASQRGLLVNFLYDDLDSGKRPIQIHVAPEGAFYVNAFFNEEVTRPSYTFVSESTISGYKRLERIYFDKALQKLKTLKQ